MKIKRKFIMCGAALFLLLLILGIYHITRPEVRLKEKVFTFDYTDEIPYDSSYYFTGQDANQNVKFEKTLFDIKKSKSKG